MENLVIIFTLASLVFLINKDVSTLIDWLIWPDCFIVLDQTSTFELLNHDGDQQDIRGGGVLLSVSSNQRGGELLNHDGDQQEIRREESFNYQSVVISTVGHG